MAPEVLRADDNCVTPMADIWSLGVILWEVRSSSALGEVGIFALPGGRLRCGGRQVLTGQVPYEGRRLPQIIFGVAISEPPW
jgi:hypothetical protein